jgi:2-C-methyl-D-erythritol 4-phosphate cytidylyltransferase
VLDHGATWTIVVAGGSGTRFGSAKQFELIGAERVIDKACDVARRSCDRVVVVLPSAAESERWSGEHADVAVVGGETRSESVRAGLRAVPAVAEVVCVHDAARPLASAELFARVVAAVRAGADGAVPAIAVTDTVKVVDHDGVVASTLDRSTLVAVQTPQAFRAAVLRDALAAGVDDTDDAAAVERHGGRVVTVAGEPWNRKITERDDLDWVRAWLATEVGS